MDEDEFNKLRDGEGGLMPDDMDIPEQDLGAVPFLL